MTLAKATTEHEALRHMRTFENVWLEDAKADYPDVADIDLYHDLAQAYMSAEIGDPAVRKEFSRITGVLEPR